MGLTAERRSRPVVGQGLDVRHDTGELHGFGFFIMTVLAIRLRQKLRGLRNLAHLAVWELGME